jgi:hypothetical protein
VNSLGLKPVDDRLVEATLAQLARRPAGATRVGWKFGSGEDEQIGGDHIVGHLTSATTLEPGATYVGGGSKLHADVEVAVEIGQDLKPVRYAVALEICDLASNGNLENVIVGNDYHRAVVFGSFSTHFPHDETGTLVVNDERRAGGPAPRDVAERVIAVERVLHAVGESLQTGDRVITGLIVNTPLKSGDSVFAALGSLGRVGLAIA